ncbi:MAG: AAA family ATPase [Planctomycetaceae bacterium]
MSDHPSSETAVPAPGFEAEPRPQGETGAAEPKRTPPPGCWLIPEKLPFYPDRKFGNHLNQFAPIHHENNGWLWPDQVRAGDVVVVVGEAGAGKSTLMADWIARVTSGTPFPGCGPDQAPPAGDVVVFNGRDDFARKVIPDIAAAGGDVDRVYRASEMLFELTAENGLPLARQFWGNKGIPEVHLASTKILENVFRFLKHRPSVRMVVIDQANVHLRCDSERTFQQLVEGLGLFARRFEVTFVITMQPNAFRNGEGVAKYLQSRSLRENAHSVWRLATPTDPEVPGRVLEIVKTCYGNGDADRPAWHLTRGSDHRLVWNEATGTELAPTKDLLKHRHLVRVLEYVDQILLVLGGMAVWKVLAERAAQHGIQPRHLREALVYGNLPSLFEPHEGDVREVVGYPELIEARREAQRAQQAAARAELLKNRSPILSDLAAGLAPPPATTAPPPTEKTSAEPAVPPAASPPVSGPAAGGSIFIQPKATAETAGVGEPTRVGETTPRNGVKHPTTNAKKVAQAG